jgi:hypothetical protein
MKKAEKTSWDLENVGLENRVHIQKELISDINLFCKRNKVSN